MAVEFENIGYSMDYYVLGKYFGSIRVEKADREVYGYLGRKLSVTDADIVLSNKKKIKAGTEVKTELFPLCGRMITHITIDVELKKC